MATHHDKRPSEHTYQDYRDSIETAAEELENEIEHYDDVHRAIFETVDSSRWHMMNGYNLMAVLLSDQNPDSPEYCEPWTTYADLSDDPSYSDVVMAMAFVCIYSDIYDLLKRRGNVDGI